MKKINAFKFIYLVIQCFEHTNTVLFQKCIYHIFFAITQFYDINIKMSEGTFCHVEAHLVARGCQILSGTQSFTGRKH